MKWCNNTSTQPRNGTQQPQCHFGMYKWAMKVFGQPLGSLFPVCSSVPCSIPFQSCCLTTHCEGLNLQWIFICWYNALWSMQKIFLPHLTASVWIRAVFHLRGCGPPSWDSLPHPLNPLCKAIGLSAPELPDGCDWHPPNPLPIVLWRINCWVLSTALCDILCNTERILIRLPRGLLPSLEGRLPTRKCMGTPRRQLLQQPLPRRSSVIPFYRLAVTSALARFWQAALPEYSQYCLMSLSWLNIFISDLLQTIN